MGEQGGSRHPRLPLQDFAKKSLLNSSLNLATWSQLKKNLFCNIALSCSPLTSLNYRLLFTFSVFKPYLCLLRN